MTQKPVGPQIGKHLNRYRQIATMLTDEGLFATIDAAGLRRVASGEIRVSIRPTGFESIILSHYRERKR